MPQFLAPSLVSLWIAGVISSAAVSPVHESQGYFPAGLATESGSVGCVRTMSGGVEAVDLATGKRLWNSDAPSRALVVEAESAILLEERGGRLQLTAREPRSGRLIRTWPCDVSLPGWASLAEPSAGRTWTTFAVLARRDGDVVDIGYDARQQVALGIAPPDAGPEARGIIRFEWGTEKVEDRPGESLAPLPFVDLSLHRGFQPLRFHARAAGPALMLGGPPPDVQGALVAGDWRIGFEKAPNGRGVIVHRWRASTDAEERLVEIPGDTDLIWPTLDRGHVALRRAHQQSRFDVFSLASGARAATLEHPIDIAVVGGRILWTTPSGRDEIALVATEAFTGRTLWSRTVWRAPPPGEPIP